MANPDDPSTAAADPALPAVAGAGAESETLAEPAPRDGVGAGAMLNPAEVMRSVARPAHREPEQIGPYRILEKLGEGGMGVVYKAEQKQPVRRLVALKVIKLGMDTNEVVARFEAERQALALMSHPNVAKVYEAGVTSEGRPFFAMEFVAGVPLTRYCDESRLTTRERLELFIQVCQAVQHAHQKGIIHRDLKPSNILVTHFDGKPVPKVIDFGIAKAANQALTDRTLYTRTGSVIGTPEYMSPEQALTSGLDVDTRSDVYSLGVILYELLTGSLPFDAKSLLQGGLEEMARIIKETNPHKPSTKLGMLEADPSPAGNGLGGSGGGTRGATNATLSDVAQRRRSDPRSLRREIRGDLDWIVLKAMDKDRTRRYETANALAMDVRRHLDHEPVLARPPSAAYRISKFVHRHKAGVAAAAAVVLALTAGMWAATYGLVRARRERDNAVTARLQAEELRLAAEGHRQAAEQATARLGAANRFLRDLLISFSGNRSPDALADVTRRLEEGWLRDEPDTHAAVRIALGFVVLQRQPGPQGAAEAERHFDRALDLLGRSGGSDDRVPPEAGGVIYFGLGLLRQHYQNRPAEAEAFYRKALDAYRRIPGTAAASAQVLQVLIAVCERKGDAGEVRRLQMELLTAGIGVHDQRLAANPDDAQSLAERGTLKLRAGRFREGLADLARATELAPDEHFNWYRRGMTELYLGDREAHRRTCEEMFKRFAEADAPEARERTAKTALAAPEPPGDVAEYLWLAEGTVASGAGHQYLPWFQLCKGLAEYRAGRYEAAIATLAEARGLSGPAVASLDFLTAMAHHRLGNSAGARRSLQEGQEKAAGRAPEPGRDDIGQPENYLFYALIRGEAEGLIGNAGGAGEE